MPPTAAVIRCNNVIPFDPDDVFCFAPDLEKEKDSNNNKNNNKEPGRMSFSG